MSPLHVQLQPQLHLQLQPNSSLTQTNSQFFLFFFLSLSLQGEDSVEYFLGLTPSGIVVLRNKTTVAHYYWPRIAKVYYKGRYFMLRISDKNVNSHIDYGHDDDSDNDGDGDGEKDDQRSIRS